MANHTRFSLQCFVVVLIVTAAPWSFGADQQVYALKDILLKEVDASGEAHHSVSEEAVDYFLDRIASHAKEYPPQFDSDDQRKTIEHELKSVILTLEMASENSPIAEDLLWRLGFACSMAYNLDLPQSAEKTDHYFQRSLSLNTDHPQGNFFYGAYLAGTDIRQRESIPYLEKAVRMGFDDAVFMLGFVHLSLKQEKKALKYFHQYLEKYPDNEWTQQIIDSIKTNRVERFVE